MTPLTQQERQTLAQMLEFRQHGARLGPLLKLSALSLSLTTVFILTVAGGFALFRLWVPCALSLGLWLGVVFCQALHVRQYVRGWRFQSQFYDWPKIEAVLAAAPESTIVSQQKERP